jgi:hypothetical protein
MRWYSRVRNSRLANESSPIISFPKSHSALRDGKRVSTL